MKIRPVGDELFHAVGQTETDGRTNLRKLIVTFRNFTNVPKMSETLVWPRQAKLF